MAFKQTSFSLTNLQFLVIDDREVSKKLSKTISQITHTFIFPFFLRYFPWLLTGFSARQFCTGMVVL